MNKETLDFNPRIFTLASLIIGYSLIDDFTANEQNAIGNWLITIGQILESNSAVQQVIEERIKGHTLNINSRQFKNGGSPFMNNQPLLDFLSPDDIEIQMIKEALQKILDKLNDIN